VLNNVHKKRKNGEWNKKEARKDAGRNSRTEI
jgi:hypothetical protein